MPADSHVQIVAAILASILLVGLSASVGVFFLVFWFNRVESHIKMAHKRNNTTNRFIGVVTLLRQEVKSLETRVSELNQCCEHCVKEG